MNRRSLIMGIVGSSILDVPIPNNEIWYTTSDGSVVTFYRWAELDFGANVVSNNYINGQGIISFDGPVTKIEYETFRSCKNLTSVTIPNNVTTIGEHAFYACTSLTSIIIPNSVTTIGVEAFRNCQILTNITIPDSVTTIEEGAFENCYGFTNITIPDSVNEIGTTVFNRCKNLISITIPNSVTSIGHGAFNNCNSLTSVTIPDSVTTIGNAAFSYCDKLTSIYCKPTTPPSLGGTSVFDVNAASRKIYVPINSVDAYKSATNWSEYADAIEGYNF